MSLPTTWTTRDGRTLLISEMSNDHLVNTINMIRRKNRDRAGLWYAYTAPQWDGSFDVTDGDVDRWLLKRSPQFVALVAEYNRRVARTLANMLAVFSDGTIVRGMQLELD